MTRRLRLVKVAVQPVFVIDDGDTLTEVQGQAITVPGGDWTRFAAAAFTDDELATLLGAYDAQQSDG